MIMYDASTGVSKAGQVSMDAVSTATIKDLKTKGNVQEAIAAIDGAHATHLSDVEKQGMDAELRNSLVASGSAYIRKVTQAEWEALKANTGGTSGAEGIDPLQLYYVTDSAAPATWGFNAAQVSYGASNVGAALDNLSANLGNMSLLPAGQTSATAAIKSLNDKLGAEIKTTSFTASVEKGVATNISLKGFLHGYPVLIIVGQPYFNGFGLYITCEGYTAATLIATVLASGLVTSIKKVSNEDVEIITSQGVFVTVLGAK